MANKEQRVHANFELLGSNEEFSVFKRIVKSRGRDGKEIKRIENILPKTTIYYFSDEEFDRLKQIESELIEEFLCNQNKKKKFIKDTFWQFLKI